MWPGYVIQHILGFRGEKLKDFFDDLEIEKVIPKLLNYVYESASSKNAIWILGEEFSRLRPITGSPQTLEPEQTLYKNIRLQGVHEISDDELLAVLAEFKPDSTSPEIASFAGSTHLLMPIIEPKSRGVLAYILLMGLPTAQVSKIRAKVSGDLAHLSKHIGFSLKHWTTQKMSFLDDLTELYNQKYMGLVLENEIIRSQRENNKFSVLFMDVDYFKAVNDSRGHWVGSHLLVEIGRNLKNSVRRSDYAFRYGGDEFVVVLPQTTAEQAKIAAERLRSRIEKTDFIIDGEQLRLTLSIGIATFPDHAKTHKDIIQMADTAMYCGKNKSRNIVFVAS